jgi:hypothetical protein
MKPQAFIATATMIAIAVITIVSSIVTAWL